MPMLEPLSHDDIRRFVSKTLEQLSDPAILKRYLEIYSRNDCTSLLQSTNVFQKHLNRLPPLPKAWVQPEHFGVGEAGGDVVVMSADPVETVAGEVPVIPGGEDVQNPGLGDRVIAIPIWFEWTNVLVKRDFTVVKRPELL